MQTWKLLENADYFLWINEEVSGPFKSIQVKEMLEDGQVNWQTLAKVGAADWATLAHYKVLESSGDYVAPPQIKEAKQYSRKWLIGARFCGVMGVLLTIVALFSTRWIELAAISSGLFWLSFYLVLLDRLDLIVDMLRDRE